MKWARPGFHLCCCQWYRVFYIFSVSILGPSRGSTFLSRSCLKRLRARLRRPVWFSALCSALGSRLCCPLSAWLGTALASALSSAPDGALLALWCRVLYCFVLDCGVLSCVWCVVLCCVVLCLVAFWHLVLCCDALCCAVLLLHAVLSCILHLLRLCARGWLCLRVALRCACVCCARCCSMRAFENIKKVLPFLVTNP